MSRIKKILKELADVAQDTASGITLTPITEGDLTHLEGTFIGPPDTPYAGGRFKVDIQVPQEYPFKPPAMKFTTRVYHPNVLLVTGAICLDILTKKWTPVLTCKLVLMLLQLLLQLPEPLDPQDAEVARVFLQDPAAFDATAREWTATYALAGVEPSVEPALVAKFTLMGFAEATVRGVLDRMGLRSLGDLDGGKEESVVEALLG